MAQRITYPSASGGVEAYLVEPVDKVPNIRCPVMGRHYGGEDPGITSPVPQLAEAMNAHNKDFTYFVYEGAKHAFFNDQRPNYHPGAAKLSWERTLEFFQRHVKGARSR